jgi:hypothetical protein
MAEGLNTPDLVSAIKGTIARFAALDRGDFEGGDCHSFAIALYDALRGSGSLCACLRQSFCEDGSKFSLGYSHMAYETVDGELWDAGGNEADVRWEERWDSGDQPDKHGLTYSFLWKTVPRHKVEVWLQKHGAVHDATLTRDIAADLRVRIDADSGQEAKSKAPQTKKRGKIPSL